MSKPIGLPTGSTGITSLRILLIIMENTIKRQGTGIRELSEDLGIAVYGVRRHVMQLSKRGLVKIQDKRTARSIVATCTIYIDCLPPEPPDAKTQRSDPPIPSIKTTKRNVARKG